MSPRKFILIMMILRLFTSTTQDTHWARTYIDDEAISGTKRMKKTAASTIACAILATDLEWAHSFCYQDNVCSITGLKVPANQSAALMTTPVICYTEFKQDVKMVCGDFRKGYLPCYSTHGANTRETGSSKCEGSKMILPQYEDVKNPKRFQNMMNETKLKNEYFWLGAKLNDKGEFEWQDGGTTSISSLEFETPHSGDGNYLMMSSETEKVVKADSKTVAKVVCIGSQHMEEKQD